ncbi:MAG TPA: translation initiation factor IF-3 [Actinomycetota bacterium]|nr:translation initiation factor IF-3 [Actinomycetota bacterium]
MVAEYRINDRIRSPQVRVVGHDGQQVGIMTTVTALARARELDLDLVEVAPQADPPVCRIMDFGKWKYEQDVRAKESRKKQSQVIVKEMKFRPKISDHDFGIKKGHVERFLEEGDKVKVTIMFRGREMAHTELGTKLLDRLAKELSEMATVEAAPKQDGRNMTMVLAPVKRPKVGKDGKAHPHEAADGHQLAAPPAPLGHEPGAGATDGATDEASEGAGQAVGEEETG